MMALKLSWDRVDPVRPPVVLLGGLNLARTLGLANISCLVVTRDPEEPALKSRYCVGHCLLPKSDPDAAALLCSVGDALLERIGRPIPLMYGSDDGIELINRFRQPIEQRFRFVMSDPEISAALLSKDKFDDFCRSYGLPVPASFEWDGVGARNLRTAPGEVVVKPKLKLDWHHSELFQLLFDGNGKARVFRNVFQAMNNPIVARFRRRLHFQEYIPGSEDSLWSFHGFVTDHGEPVASFVGRKLRTYPVEIGESALIALAHSAELTDLGFDVARRCGIRGVFKMDFKRDIRNGRWYLLEINARFNLWHYLGAANGINLPAMAYEYLLHDRIPAQTRYSTHVRWLSFPLYMKAYRESVLNRRQPLLPWVYDVVRYPTIYSLFAWRDPGPWLHACARRLKHLQLRLNRQFR